MNTIPRSSSRFSAIRRAAVLVVAHLLISSMARAAGTEGAAFLNIPVGAGPAALGSAYTAMATDAYAPVINAAGLGFLPSTQLAGQHLSYLEGITYEYASLVHPLGKGRSLGAAVQYLGSGDIEGRDAAGLENSDFSLTYAAYTLAYGQTLSKKLAVGMAGKWIYAKIDDLSASAYAADLSGFYRATSKLQLGLNLTNIGSKLSFIDEGDPLPLALKVGAAYQMNRHWLLSTEGVYRKSGLASGHLGLQWRPIDLLSLRAGYRTDTLKGLDALAGVSAGLGLEVWGQELSYAWLPYGDLGNSQYISLVMRFGAVEEAKRNLIQYRDIKRHQTVSSPPVQEPEYDQLMQLLAAEDIQSARTTDQGVR